MAVYPPELSTCLWEQVHALSTMRLSELREYLDGYLRIAEVPDWSGALNGLQVDSPRDVSRVACAVDAAQATVEPAVAWGAELLLVHHGLFWDGNVPVTGRRYRRLKAALDADLAIYSAHLPLDVHPEVGNNPLLARELGIEPRGTFGEYKGLAIGVWGEVDVTRDELHRRAEEVLGVEVKLVPGGPERIRRAGVITGGGADEIAAAAAAGLGALLPGEGTAHKFFSDEGAGVNLLLGGHYATETWGVRALARHLEERFGLE